MFFCLNFDVDYDTMPSHFPVNNLSAAWFCNPLALVSFVTAPVWFTFLLSPLHSRSSGEVRMGGPSQE